MADDPFDATSEQLDQVVEESSHHWSLSEGMIRVEASKVIRRKNIQQAIINATTVEELKPALLAVLNMIRS